MLATKRDQLLQLVSPLPLQAEVVALLIDKEAQGLSARTIQLYRAELGYFCAYLQDQGMHNLLDVTSTTIRRWLLHLAKRPTPGGVHVSYRVLKTFFRWCWLEYEIDSTNPIARVRRPKVPAKTLPPLSLDVLTAMLDACSHKTFTGCRDRAILLALLHTGCRASEFVSLDVGDVDLASGAVWVREAKGGKSRVTFLGAKSRRELVRFLRRRQDVTPGVPLWVTVKGERLAYWGLRQIIRRRAEKAGVPVPSLHSFGRAFALYALRNGTDICSLQRLMGHSDLTVLRRYLKQTEADLQEAHRTAGPADNLLEGWGKLRLLCLERSAAGRCPSPKSIPWTQRGTKGERLRQWRLGRASHGTGVCQVWRMGQWARGCTNMLTIGPPHCSPRSLISPSREPGHWTPKTNGHLCALRHTPSST